MRDPAIFSNRGGVLLKTEKEKKQLLKELPRVEARVTEQLAACPGGDRFTIGGRSFQQHVQHLWEGFRADKAAAKANRRVSRASIAGGVGGSAHDLSAAGPLPTSPRKSLAPGMHLPHPAGIPAASASSVAVSKRW